MGTLITVFLRDKRGATSIEYGLIAAMIAVAAVGALQKVGSNLVAKFNVIGNKVR